MKDSFMQQAVRAYFEAWLRKDIGVVERTFSKDAVYTECYGPEYHGLEQILRWFADWNQKGTVLQWRIRRMLEQGRTVTVQWFFECDYDGTVSTFDGVSVIDFDEAGKICRLSEFQSKAEHIYPYE